MKTTKILIVLTIALLISPPSVYALTQGDYHEKFWGGGLNVWVHYPEEATPGDNININVYITSSKFGRGNQVEEVNVKITCLTGGASQTLYDNKVLNYVYMPNGDTQNTSIPLSLPSDARWYITVIIDTVSYEQDWTNRQEAHVILDTTQIRSKTYNDLEQQIQELQLYSNQLGDQITQLQNQLNNLQTTPDSEIEEKYYDLLNEYLELAQLLNQQPSDNQGATIDQDLINRVTELETLNSGLSEQIETLTAQLEGNDAEKNTMIDELNGNIESLTREKNDLAAELETTDAEYQQYKETHTVSSEEYDSLTNTIQQTQNIRNLLAVITVLSILAAATLYMRRNTTI